MPKSLSKLMMTKIVKINMMKNCRIDDTVYSILHYNLKICIIIIIEAVMLLCTKIYNNIFRVTQDS